MIDFKLIDTLSKELLKAGINEAVLKGQIDEDFILSIDFEGSVSFNIISKEKSLEQKIFSFNYKGVTFHVGEFKD